jgi:hypothetical protein
MVDIERLERINRTLRALIELGYEDTARREAEVREFFDYSEGRVHA